MLITQIHTLPAPGWKREAQLAVPALIFISRMRRAEASGLQLRKSCHPRAWASVALWRAGGARWLTAHIFLAFVSQAALKKYQTEQRSKGDALDKCQAELKKLRKKSQGSKNPQKYSDKELQVGLSCACRALCLQGHAGGLRPLLRCQDSQSFQGAMKGRPS